MSAALREQSVADSDFAYILGSRVSLVCARAVGLFCDVVLCNGAGGKGRVGGRSEGAAGQDSLEAGCRNARRGGGGSLPSASINWTEPRA